MKIRTCPFCGKKGYMEIAHDKHKGVQVYVKCEACGASGRKIKATEDSGDFIEAIAVWNMRTGA